LTKILAGDILASAEDRKLKKQQILSSKRGFVEKSRLVGATDLYQEVGGLWFMVRGKKI
jgi:hypothetical protein